MKLPVLSALEVVRILKKNGFEKKGQRGSHMRFKKHDGTRMRTVFVPNYPELHRAVLMSIIRQSGLAKEDFCS
ncbi:MAG: type II toxin-antitoxin system HicA family toxin [Candidatus Aenigmatarchaeota archaeon]